MSASEVVSAAGLSIRAEASDAQRAALWLERTGTQFGVPLAAIMRLTHCVDEALANLLAYGGAGAQTDDVVLQLSVRRDGRGGEATVTVSDSGRPFNPLAVETTPRPTVLADAKPGGLGLVMMHSFSDGLSYRYAEDRNQLTFVVRWGGLS